MSRFLNLIMSPRSIKISPICSTTKSSKASPLNSNCTSPSNGTPTNDNENYINFPVIESGELTVERKLYHIKCDKGHQLSKYASIEGEKGCEHCEEEFRNNIHKYDFQEWCNERVANIEILAYDSVNTLITYYCKKCTYTNKIHRDYLKEHYKKTGIICQNPKHNRVNNEEILNHIKLLTDSINTNNMYINRQLIDIQHRLTSLENKIFNVNDLFTNITNMK
jgi:hypothetical protein